MIPSLVATVSSLLSHTLRNGKQKEKKEEGRRGVSVTGSAKVAPLERYSWHGLHLPIVGGIFISFAFAYPATTCAASIIMINKFSLPIFDFNLQSPPSPLSLSSPPQQTVFLFLVIVLTASLNAMGRFRSSSKNFFTLFLFAFAVVLVVVPAAVALRVEATLVFISVAQLTEVYFQSTFQLFSAFCFSICFPSPSSLLVRVRHFFLSYRMQCEVGRGNPWDIYTTIFTFEQKVTFPNSKNNNKCRYKVQEIVHEIWKRMCAVLPSYLYKRTAIAASSLFQYSTWDVTEMEPKRVNSLRNLP